MWHGAWRERNYPRFTGCMVTKEISGAYKYRRFIEYHPVFYCWEMDDTNCCKTPEPFQNVAVGPTASQFEGMRQDDEVEAVGVERQGIEVAEQSDSGLGANRLRCLGRAARGG